MQGGDSNSQMRVTEVNTKKTPEICRVPSEYLAKC